MARAQEQSKGIYRTCMRDSAVVSLLDGKSVLDVATMEDEVTGLLNVTLGHYQDEYRCNVWRVITGTLDQCVRRNLIPRHALGASSLPPPGGQRGAVREGAGAQGPSPPDR
jgi:hypothetical protein